MTTEKFLMLDTETANSIEDPFYYDLGFAVIDTEGKVYEAASYVNADIFLDEEMMSTAYFKDKIPQYWAEIKAGSRLLKRHSAIRKAVREVMAKWNIKCVVAHNARFDYRATNYTQRFLTSSKYRYFFPYNSVILDTLKMAREVFANDEQYTTFCKVNNYITKRGCVKLTAEILYRFLSGNNHFEESHTGLEDVLIEKVIFTKCLEKNSNIQGRLW